MGTMLLLRGIPAAVRNAGQGIANRGLCDPLATLQAIVPPGARSSMERAVSGAATYSLRDLARESDLRRFHIFFNFCQKFIK